MQRGVPITTTPFLISLSPPPFQFAVVEDDEQLQKFLSMRSSLPEIQKIVQYKGVPNTNHADVLSWSEFMALGQGNHELDVLLTRRKQTQRVNECCTLIYTSGTTGDPKGVMLSHDNVTWTAQISREVYHHEWASEVLVSFLPLSHVAAQMVDIYGAISIAATVYFARPDALKGSLVDTLRSVQPTILFAVPRVWEKIADRLQAVGRENTGIRLKLAAWAKDIGLRGNRAAMHGGSMPWGWALANRVVFARIREALGLARCRLCLSGAAPIAKELLEYLQSINLPVYEAYGMSESSGPQTLSSPGYARLGSTGKVVVGFVCVRERVCVCVCVCIYVCVCVANIYLCVCDRLFVAGYARCTAETRCRHQRDSLLWPPRVYGLPEQHGQDARDLHRGRVAAEWGCGRC